MPSPSEDGETERLLLPALAALPALGRDTRGAIVVASADTTNGNNKRTQIAVGGPTPKRPPKRRASRACLSCRSRKVRCDVTNQSIPCTNCRLDSVECRLTESNRGRFRAVPETTQAPTQVHQQSYQQPRPRSLSRAVATSSQVTTSTRVATSPRLDFVSPRSLSDNGDSTSVCSLESTHTNNANAGQIPVHMTTEPTTDANTVLPAHFKPLPSHLQPVDIEYLARKGALTLPPEEMQREIIQKHIQYVHPFMPVIDLRAFITPLVRREPGSVSLLLFQTVMFTAANFIDLDYHVTPGQTQPPDHAAIRKEFFGRARLLYHMDCEADRFTLLQALLLMTVWYQRPGDEKETWYWTGVMLSLALTLGLHRNPEHLCDVPPAMRLLRKHMWWSCVIQDRLLALGLKRPSRIRAGDYDVPPLTFADFGIETLSSELLRYLGPLPLSDDLPSKTSIVMAFIGLSKLCEHIGDILATQYTTLLGGSMNSNNPNSLAGERGATSLDHMSVMLVPRTASECGVELDQCDAALDAWAAALDPGARFRAGRSEKDSSHRVLWLHQALLRMVHLTTVVILHRPRVMQADNGGTEGASVDADMDDPEFAASIRRSKDKITQAAAGVTEVVYDLYHNSQLRFVSPAAISALVSATLIHLFDIGSAVSDSRYTSIGRFYQCWQALHYLRGLYTSADQSIAFLEFYINKKQVNIPMLNLSSTFSSSLSTSGTATPRTRRQHQNAMSVMATLHGDGPRVPDLSTVSTASTTSMPAPMTPLIYSPRSPSVRRMCPAPASAMASSQAPEMEPGIVVGPHMHLLHPQPDQWNGIGTVDSMLQSFIDFSADPAFFSATATGDHDAMVGSPITGLLRYV